MSTIAKVNTRFDFELPPSFWESKNRAFELERIVRKRSLEIDEQLSEFSEEEKSQILFNQGYGFGTLLDCGQLPPAGPEVTGLSDNVISLNQQPYPDSLKDPSFLPAYFVEIGRARERAVGRIATNSSSFPGVGWATGFLVSPSVIMTSSHAIYSREFARTMRFQLNYQRSPTPQPVAVDEYDFLESGFFHTSPTIDLDYTLIQLKPKIQGQSPFPGHQYGWISLGHTFSYSPQLDINSIQHPNGDPKVVVLRNSELISIHANVVRYNTPTLSSSSGCPMFNNSWIAIAVHQAKCGQIGSSLSNQGVRMDKIVNDIRANAPSSLVADLGL